MPLIVVTSPKAKTGRASLVVNIGFGPVRLYDQGLPPGDLVGWTALVSGG